MISCVAQSTNSQGDNYSFDTLDQPVQYTCTTMASINLEIDNYK